MDFLRGAAIFLVVLWHLEVVATQNGVNVPEVLHIMNAAFRPFRMPTLMFISGMLLQRSLRKPLRIYYFGKVRTLVWPYVIWATVFLAVARPHTMLDIRQWLPAGHLWFLYFITIYYLLAPLLKRVPSWIVAILAFSGSAIMPQASIPDMGLYFAGFFFLGHFASEHPSVVERVTSRSWLWLYTVAASVMLTASIVDSSRLVFRAELAPFALAGVLVLLNAAKLADGLSWTRPVRFIGRNSIVYYVAHYPIYLLLLPLFSPSRWSLPIGLCAVLAIATLLALLKQTRAGGVLFEFPASGNRKLRNRDNVN